MIILKRLLFVVVVLGLAACEQANIINPANNSSSPVKPEKFEIVFSNGIPSDLAIQLNLEDVTAQFDVTDTGAVADGADLEDFVFPGRNTLRVSAYNKVTQSIFTYDVSGPKVHILNTDRNTMTVTGYVADSGGVESLSLDGSPVALDANNNFSTAFIDQPFNVFTAIDGYGHESRTELARKDQEFSSGIAARLNQGGFDFLVSALEQELAKTDFQSLVDDLEPITLLDAGIFDLTLRITHLNLDNVDIDLVVRDDEKIDADIHAENVVFGAAIGGSVWTIVGKIPWSTGATIQMNRLDAGTALLLDILNSDLDVGLSGTTVDHSRLNINLDATPNILGFFDRIVSSIVSAIAPLFERLFIVLLEQIIVPIVSDFIKDIPIQLHLVTLDDGEQLRIKALPTYLDSFANGVSVDLGTRIWAPEPAAGVPGALGSLYRGGDTPSLGDKTPSGKSFDFGASISDNVINQALFAAHEAGVTTMEIRPEIYANATPEGIAVYNADGSEIKEADKIGMRIKPASQPYVKFMPGEGAAGMFGWDDVELYFDLYKPAWGEYRTLFGVTFNLEVAFDVNTTEDGYLSIGIEQLPVIQITATDNTGMILIPPSFINSTLDYFMPAVLPRLAQELKAVPLPRIYNHTLFMEEFWIAGSADNNLSLAGSLIPISTTESAPAPTTKIDNVATANVSANVDSIDASGVISSESVNIANGEVTINVSGLNPNPALGLLEYRYRVDGGGWTVWKPRRTIKLSRLLAGDHEVEICSRTVLLKREVSCPVVEFTTTVQ